MKRHEYKSFFIENYKEIVASYSYQLNFIRCVQSKTVISVLDNCNIGALLHGFIQKLKVNLLE